MSEAQRGTGSSSSFGQDNFYVQSLKINEVDWSRNWFEHDDIMVSGGAIGFEPGPDMKI